MISGTAFAKPIANQLQANSTSPSHKLVVDIKWIVTALALLAAGLITVTYGILIGAGTRMTSTSKLPLSSIVHNIGAILEVTWPNMSSTTVCGTTEADTIRLMYIADMSDAKGQTARGLRQCEALPDADIATPLFWLTSGSQLTTSIVQLAVWEWVFLWMSVAMVISTLLYNGVLTNNLGPDSYVRVTLVLMYAAAYYIHAIFMWRVVTSFFTMVAAGSAWSMLNRANFAVVDLSQFKHRLDCSGTSYPLLDFRVIDKASTEFVPVTYAVNLEHEEHNSGVESPVIDRMDSPSSDVLSSLATTAVATPLEENSGLRDALATIKAVQKWERQNAIDAARTALDRVVANGMIMTAVVVSSGFTMWTAAPTDAKGTQLGSLGLLASLSLGVAAMFTSAVQMTILNSAFKMVLHLKEIKINGHAVDYTKKRASARKSIGFSYGRIKAHQMRVRDLLRTSTVSDVLWLLLFGPAYILLPTSADHALESEGAQFQLTANVRGETIVMTTGSTDKHSRDKQGASLEAINVCYRPRSATRSAAIIDGSRVPLEV